MHGTSWIIILLLLNAAYFYTHYFFKPAATRKCRAVCGIWVSVCIHIPAADGAYAGVSLLPPVLPLTQYTHARGPILFGAGYA